MSMENGARRLTVSHWLAAFLHVVVLLLLCLTAIMYLVVGGMAFDKVYTFSEVLAAGHLFSLDHGLGSLFMLGMLGVPTTCLACAFVLTRSATARIAIASVPTALWLLWAFVPGPLGNIVAPFVIIVRFPIEMAGAVNAILTGASQSGESWGIQASMFGFTALSLWVVGWTTILALETATVLRARRQAAKGKFAQSGNMRMSNAASPPQ